MGCVSSAFLEEGAEDLDRRRIISHHHIVSLTSSTYGILTYSSSPTAASAAAAPPATTTSSSAPPPPPPPPPPTNLRSHPRPQPEEVINSWELMAGLHDPSTPARPPLPPTPSSSSSSSSSCCKQPDRRRRIRFPLRPIDANSAAPPPPPSATSAPRSAVLYTTSLRGVRSTFEACNAVRAALQAHGVAFRERDVSMDRGFREELKDLLLIMSSSSCSSSSSSSSIPRLFVRGRHVGGAEEVLRLDELGLLAPLLEGLPRAPRGSAACCCDGCGGMRFLPCFDCSGSRKVAVPIPDPPPQQQQGGGACRRRTRGAMVVVVRCGECNENGLVLCPICS